MSARERRGAREPTGACTVLSCVGGGGRITPQGSTANVVVEPVGAGAGEPAGCTGLADQTGGRRTSLTLEWSPVAVLVHTGLLERRVAVAGSGPGAPTGARTNSQASQSAL